MAEGAAAAGAAGGSGFAALPVLVTLPALPAPPGGVELVAPASGAASRAGAGVAGAAIGDAATTGAGAAAGSLRLSPNIHVTSEQPCSAANVVAISVALSVTISLALGIGDRMAGLLLVVDHGRRSMRRARHRWGIGHSEDDPLVRGGASQ